MNRITAGQKVPQGRLSHLGIQVSSTEDVFKVKQYWEELGLSARDEIGVSCCYAIQDKYLSVKSISCSRIEKYGPFKLHLGCKIIAINPAGNGIEITGIRTVIELNGKFKLYHLRRE